MVLAERVSFYTNQYDKIIRSSLSKPDSIFKCLSIISSTDKQTVFTKINANVAVKNFLDSSDLSYESLVVDSKALPPIQAAFESLSRYIKEKTDSSVDKFLTDNNIKVTQTYATLSGIFGSSISLGNIL